MYPAEVSESDDELVFPHANIEAIASLRDFCATSFGPTPRDKLIISALATRSDTDPRVDPPTDDYVVTSDGATILEELDIQHPVGSLVQQIAGPQQPGETDVEGKDITDGVKTSLLLLAALLEEARDLIDDGVHPKTIQQGYDHARGIAREALSAARLEPTETTVFATARSALTGNEIGAAGDKWAQMAVEAVSQVGVPDEYSLAVRHASGRSINESRFVRGTVLDKNERAYETMPRRIEDASVLVLGGREEGGLNRRRSDREITVTADDPDYTTQFDALRERHRQEVFETILSLNVDVVVARTGITRSYQNLLADHDILGIRRVNSQKLHQLARATGAMIITDRTNISKDMLGTAGVVEEIKLPEFWTESDERRMIVVDECPNPESVAILLTGVWRQLADQLTTTIRKAALAAAMARGAGNYNPGSVPGGGAVEIQITRTVRDQATEYGTKEQLAVYTFADAVEDLVRILAHNGGLDPTATIADLRQAHERGEIHAGIVLPAGRQEDVVTAGVLDPFERKRRCIDMATEVANLVLNIDDAIDATFTDEPAQPGESINDDTAQRHMDYLDNRLGSARS